MKSCDKQDEIVKRYEDSIKARTAEIAANKKEGEQRKAWGDSVFSKSVKDSADAKHRNDSLTVIIHVLQNKYSTAKDSTITLWAQLKKFYLAGDSASLRTAYYELRAELDSLNNSMVAIEFQYERKVYNLQTDADSAHAAVRTLYLQLDALKSLLDRQTQIAETQNREEAKILEKQKKRKIWSLIKDISIGLAGIFIGKKL